MPFPISLFRLPFKLRRRARRRRIATMLTILAVMCTIITPLYIIYKPPTLLIQYLQYRWPEVLFHVPTTSKIIALTIDDGPSEYTADILDVLKANGATATFFVIGAQASGREEVLKDLVRNGDELGNHAMHDEPSRSLSDTALLDQLLTVENLIQETYVSVALKPPPKYFRPGSGFFSERMRRLLSQAGYRLILGSIYPHDPQIPWWRVNARHVLSMARPGGVIICHDRRSWTVPMLKRVLPELVKRGYRIVTVTELLKEEKKG